MSINEKDLVPRLIEGNEDAFRQLVNSFKDRVFNTSIGLLQNAEDAEDITQEVFIEVFNSIGKFRQDAALSTWIYRITVTKSLDLIRRKKRKKRFGFVISIFGGEGKIEKEPSDFIHPGIEAENKELSVALFKAIEKLPPNQKIAFTLSKIELLSYKEISDVMNVTIASVESLLHRARTNLKTLLNDYYSGT